MGKYFAVVLFLTYVHLNSTLESNFSTETTLGIGATENYYEHENSKNTMDHLQRETAVSITPPENATVPNTNIQNVSKIPGLDLNISWSGERMHFGQELNQSQRHDVTPSMDVKNQTTVHSGSQNYTSNSMKNSTMDDTYPQHQHLNQTTFPDHTEPISSFTNVDKVTTEALTNYTINRYGTTKQVLNVNGSTDKDWDMTEESVTPGMKPEAVNGTIFPQTVAPEMRNTSETTKSWESQTHMANSTGTQHWNTSVMNTTGQYNKTYGMVNTTAIPWNDQNMKNVTGKDYPRMNVTFSPDIVWNTTNATGRSTSGKADVRSNSTTVDNITTDMNNNSVTTDGASCLNCQTEAVPPSPGTVPEDVHVSTQTTTTALPDAGADDKVTTTEVPAWDGSEAVTAIPGKFCLALVVLLSFLILG